MPWVGFEPTVPASERAKTVHALDRSATVTGFLPLQVNILTPPGYEPKDMHLTLDTSVMAMFSSLQDGATDA
jgi:hypothetical protein